MKCKMKPAFAGVLVSLLFLLTPIHAAAFSDVAANAPYADAVAYVSQRGIIEGYSDGQFKPNNTLTRGQISVMICRMLGESENLPVNGALFSDMPASVWCNGHVTKAVSLNIINGFADGTFRPNSIVSYNQAIAMLLRAFGLREEAEHAGGYPNGYLTVANRYHLLDGVDFQSKNGGIKRYETAVIIYNYYQQGIEDPSETEEPNGIFDETYWLLNVSPGDAGNFFSLFHKNGTYSYIRYTDFSTGEGTYSYDGTTLLIDNIAYTWENDAFYSTKSYFAMGASELGWQFSLSPDAGKGYQAIMKERQTRGSAEAEINTTLSPILNVAAATLGRDYSSLTSDYGEPKAFPVYDDISGDEIWFDIYPKLGNHIRLSTGGGITAYMLETDLNHYLNPESNTAHSLFAALKEYGTLRSGSYEFHISLNGPMNGQENCSKSCRIVVTGCTGSGFSENTKVMIYYVG